MAKGQASVEYLIVMGFGIMILIPLIVLFYDYVHGTSKDVVESQLSTIGTDIVDNAEFVYYMGEPARVTLLESFPEQLKGLCVNPHEVYFITQDGSHISYPSEVELDGFYDRDNHLCICDDEDSPSSCWSAGKKNIRIEALPNTNAITLTVY